MPTVDSGQATVWWDSTGSGTPILLINGLSSPSAAWFRLAPLLESNHRVLTFDNLGTGRTRAPSCAYTVPMLADAATAVVRDAGESAAHVLGISMGGLVAQELALSYPELVRSLTLVSTHAGGPHMRQDQATLDLLAQAASMSPEERTSALARLAFAETTPVERVEEDLARRADYPTTDEGYRNQLTGTARWERLADLPRIACPTMVVHGERDRMVSIESARQLAENIPNAQLSVLPHAGHQLFTDQPEAGARTVLDFVAAVDGER
ncbi:alpha/beta fold hydrolase [Dietzia sp. KRD202]|uniref:alpha/beta fold hydrolase n=1 Tax=Dietzia sp. KRD202 TaxID=2729732 RepID=UPI0019D0CC07|nr:alpha/beta hydrolase [Dietzia sp. KRD202]